MNAAAAKRLARSHSFDLWYDRKQRLWVIQKLLANGDTDVHHPSGYIAPRPLASITPQSFVDSYLKG